MRFNDILNTPVSGRPASRRKTPYARPARPCPFCSVVPKHSKLSRHIAGKHSNIKEVADAMTKDSLTRQKLFAAFRKRGIVDHNRGVLQTERSNGADVNLLCEKSGSSKPSPSLLSMCKRCNGFYQKATFYRHKLSCSRGIDDTASMDRGSIPASVLAVADSQDTDSFGEYILAKFANDDVGNFCRTDACLMKIGKSLWQKMRRKPGKKTEVKKSVMRDMRRLAQLFIAMKEKVVPAGDFTFAQMFSCTHFASLEETIEQLTEAEEDQGHSIRTGLKLGLRYLIPHAANITQGFMLMDRQTDRSAEVDAFLKVFNLRRDYIFSDAEYQACNSRLAKLRRPEQLPKSDDLQLFKSFVSAQLVKFTGDPYHLWGSNDFVMLRDILVARLTLFNARRGGEPCRLLLDEWRDAEKGVWVDNSAAAALLDPVERQLVSNDLIAYQAGKGSHHAVSTLIPKDTVEGLKMLASGDIRTQAGVESDNPFLFPYGQGSMDHVIGYHAIKKISTLAGVKEPQLLTATKIRHYTSTMYAQLDLPETDRELFYRHMGHSKEINENIYQCPLGVLTMAKVGKHLHMLDTGKYILSCFCYALFNIVIITIIFVNHVVTIYTV